MSFPSKNDNYFLSVGTDSQIKFSENVITQHN